MLGSLLGLIATLGLTLFSPLAYAASPGPVPGGPNTTSSTSTTSGPDSTRPITVQDTKWLAAKKAHRVLSGIKRGQKVKGQTGQPSILAQGNTVTPLTSPPSSSLLHLDSYANNTYEPSDGNSPNYGAGTAHTDNHNNSYSNQDFFDLCGPGAADIALDFWPKPANLLYTYISDPLYNSHFNTSQTTFWNGTQMRGYMVNLAWKIKPPTWPTAGMMDTSTTPRHWPSYGVTNYSMQDALNWEASGENSSNWQNYFYTIAWWNENNAPSYLHASVVDDVWGQSVPVVAEVNAAMLPNWSEPGQMIHHYITIIGYDDVNDNYTYTDTCGKTTNCNPGYPNYDGGYKTVSQETMWNAITNIPVNQSGDPSGGDGGWIW